MSILLNTFDEVNYTGIIVEDATDFDEPPLVHPEQFETFGSTRISMELSDAIEFAKAILIMADTTSQDEALIQGYEDRLDAQADATSANFGHD